MSININNRFDINPELKTRLVKDFSAAGNIKSGEEALSQLKKRFNELLQDTPKVDDEFMRVMNFFDKKFANHGIRLKNQLQELLLDPKSNIKIRKNIYGYLIETKNIFKEDFGFILSGKLQDSTASFIALIRDRNKLIESLRNIQLYDKDLNSLAKILLKVYDSDKLETILRQAYGTSDLSLKDAVDSSQEHDAVPYHVRRQLQSLLVEVYRLGLGTGQEKFNMITEEFSKSQNSTDRERYAQLLIEKFPHNALEFFQDLAMNENSNHDIPNLQAEAIRHYAQMKPSNLKETLESILKNTKNPETIYSTLIELSKIPKAINLKTLISLLNQDESKPILHTLLHLNTSSLDALLKKLNSNFRDFYRTLLEQIPDLVSKIQDSSSMHLISFDLSNHFRTLNEDLSAAMSNFCKPLLENLSIRELFTNLRASVGKTLRNNSAELLLVSPEQTTIDFLANQYSQEDKRMITELREQLGV